MDYPAHALWTYIFYHKKSKWYYAIPFGLLPDSLSWLIYAIYAIFTGGFFQRPDMQQIPDWVYMLYNISHSIFVFLLIAVVVYIIWRKVPIYVWAWPIHILMDIPTHSREFLPTPFLWPISDWTFPGISWGTPWFMFLNYATIVFLMLVIYVNRRREKKRKEEGGNRRGDERKVLKE